MNQPHPYPTVHSEKNAEGKPCALAIDLDDFRRIWISETNRDGTMSINLDTVQAALLAAYMAGKSEGAIAAKSGGAA